MNPLCPNGHNYVNKQGFEKGVQRYKCMECGKKFQNIYFGRFEENNGMWKGNEVGYSSLHEWIKNHKPKSDFCEECHKNKPYDLANISGQYLRDINDFKWVCRSCHMKSDGRMNNLMRGIIKPVIIDRPNSLNTT